MVCAAVSAGRMRRLPPSAARTGAGSAAPVSQRHWRLTPQLHLHSCLNKAPVVPSFPPALHPRTCHVHAQRRGQRGLPLQVGDGPQAQLCALLHLLQAAAQVLPGLQARVAPPRSLCMDLLVQAVGGDHLWQLTLGSGGAPWSPTLCAILAAQGHKGEIGAAEEGWVGWRQAEQAGRG